MHFNYFINRLTWTIEVCLPFFAWSYIVETKTKEYSSNKSLIVEKEQPISNELDQVLKLKELLDLGVINEEEFNEKKKQILNLK